MFLTATPNPNPLPTAAVPSEIGNYTVNQGGIIGLVVGLVFVFMLVIGFGILASHKTLKIGDTVTRSVVGGIGISWIGVAILGGAAMFLGVAGWFIAQLLTRG